MGARQKQEAITYALIYLKEHIAFLIWVTLSIWAAKTLKVLKM